MACPATFNHYADHQEADAEVIFVYYDTCIWVLTGEQKSLPNQSVTPIY